mgnify:CR=1 FL=1
MSGRGRRRGFGYVRKLPSGRLQARYTGPDGQEHRAPITFDTKGDAQTWLAMQSAHDLAAERAAGVPKVRRLDTVAPTGT